MSAIEPLQRAVYGLLSGSAALDALGCAVYDEVPEGAVEPYLVLGEFDEQADETHSQRGSLVTVTIHAWSRYRGYAKLARCLDAADVALHRTRPDVEGYEDVSVLVRSRQYQRDPDPALRHGIGRYEARLTKLDGTDAGGQL